MCSSDLVAVGGAEHPVTHVLDGGVRRGGSGRQATGLDDGRAALGDRRDEGGLDPGLVVHDMALLQGFVWKGLHFSVMLTLVATLGGLALGTLLALMRLSGQK